MSDSDAKEPEDMRRVRTACETLSEHFDAVHILASRHEMGTDDGTVNVSYGIGNYFARYGQIREWVLQTEERIRDSQRSE